MQHAEYRNKMGIVANKKKTVALETLIQIQVIYALLLFRRLIIIKLDRFIVCLPSAANYICSFYFSKE